MSLSTQRLKRLVNYRERLERIEEGRLAGELRRQAERQRALDETRALRGDLFDAGVPAAGPIDVDTLGATTAFALRLNRDEAARLGALAHSAQAVAEQRGVLLGKRRDRKAMEALLDRQREHERVERNRAERKRIDELAGIRWRPPGA